MRMRGDVHRLARGKGQRAVRVEKAPGSHEASLAAGQQATHRKAPQVGQAAGKHLEGGRGGRFAHTRFGNRRRSEVTHWAGTLRTIIAHRDRRGKDHDRVRPTPR